MTEHLTEEEHSLGELAKMLGLSKSRISYHLKRLEEENLIRKTREEYYEQLADMVILSDENGFKQIIQQILDEVRK